MQSTQQQQPALLSIHRIPGLALRRLPSLEWTQVVEDASQARGEGGEQVSIPCQEWNQISVLSSSTSLVIVEVCQSLSTSHVDPCLFFGQHRITLPSGLIGISADSSEMDSMKETIETRRETFQLLMDRLINPKLAVKKDEDDNKPENTHNSFCGIRSFKWCPLMRRSIFAILTHSGHILLYLRKRNDDSWTFMEKQSNLLMKRMRTRDGEIEKVTSYSEAKTIYYRKAITCISWSPVLRRVGDERGDLCEKTEKESCLLIAASKTGHIFFWRVTLRSSPQKDEVNEDDLEATFIHEWDSQAGQVNCIFCAKSSLFLGTERGQVFAVPHVTSLLSHGGEKGSSGQQLPLFHPRALLSEEDGIPVNLFIVHPKIDDRFLLIVPKMTFTLIVDASLISHTSTARREESSTDLSFSFNIIGSRIVELGNQMPPTDLRLIKGHPSSSTTFLMSSADGRLIKVVLPSDALNQDCAIRTECLSLEGLFKGRSVINGIASSSHGNVFAVLQQIVGYHDTVLAKDSTILALYSNISYDDLCTRLDDLMNESQAPNGLVLDYMLAFRGFLDKGKQPSLDFISKLGDLTDRSKLCLKVSRMRAVAIRDWMRKDSEGKSMKKEVDVVNSLLTRLDRQLRQMYVDRIFSWIDSTTKTRQNKSELTPSQKKSLALLSSWYKNTTRTLPRGQRQTPKAYELDTPCPLCKLPIPLSIDDTKAGSCPNGHNFPRCCYSLLVCDPLNMKFTSCSLCQSVFVVPSIWPEAVDSRQCPLCF